MKKRFAQGCQMLALLLVTFTCISTALAAPFDWERAVSLYKQGQLREAVEEFQKVLAEYPDHSDSWKFIGLAQYQLKNYNEAITALEKSLALKQKEGRNDPDLLRALGQSQLELKSYDKALPYFETLAKAQPNVAATFYLLGVIYANLNRAGDAADSFQKAVKLDPKDGDSWYYLGVQQFREGKYTEAVSSLKLGLAAEPKNAEMLGLMAETQLRLGGAETNEKRAAQFFDEAIRAATSLRALREDAPALELQGRALLAAKKYQPAEAALTRAAELTKEPSATLFFNLGLAQAQTRNWPRAAESLARADKLAPGDFNTLYYLGYVNENLRRYPAALDAYTRAYEASGRSNADVKASIDRVTTLAKQP